MHTKPTLQDWKVVAVNSNCVMIKISEDLSLEGIKFKILGESRNFLFEVEPESREIVFCAPTGNPMFVELHTLSGVSVHYVEGSGKDFYNKLKNN
jgi:hypothetical protein